MDKEQHESQNSGDLPGIRNDLQIIPVRKDGRQFILVRDMIGLIPDPVILGQKELLVFSLLSQCHSYTDLQYMLMQYLGGVLITRDEIEKLVNKLDAMLLLDTGRYREAYKILREEFQKLKIRPAACAGRSYPREERQLREFLQNILDAGKEVESPGKITALIVPHIDIEIGMRAYSRGYACLKGKDFKRVIILGVGHSMSRGIFCPSRKDFATPLGIVKTDTDAVERILNMDSDTILREEIPHKDEHSIEFQLIFLQYLLEKPDFQIVPVLMGSAFPYLQKVARFSEIPGVRPVLDILKEIMLEDAENTLLLAGVDLSHVGKKFGDRAPAQAITPESNLFDNRLLKALMAKSPERFWQITREIDDAYHVCGFSALSCLLELLPDCPGKLLHYETWHEESTQSAVSFASVVFQ